MFGLHSNQLVFRSVLLIVDSQQVSAREGLHEQKCVGMSENEGPSKIVC